MNHISRLCKCGYFWGAYTPPSDCLLATCLVTCNPPCDLLLATSRRNNKSVIYVIALVWPVIWETKTTDILQRQRGSCSHNNSDSSPQYRTVAVWRPGVSLQVNQTQAETETHLYSEGLAFCIVMLWQVNHHIIMANSTTSVLVSQTKYYGGGLLTSYQSPDLQ